MTLLSGIRNLLARRRETNDHPTATDLDHVQVETGLREEIEAKPVEIMIPEPSAPPEPEVVDEDEQDDSELMDIDDLDDLEEPDEIDLADRLDEMETRLNAGGADMHRLMKELDGHIEGNAVRSQDLVQQLDERIQTQARETRQVVKKLDARFEVVADESKRLAKQATQLPALAEQVADINRQCERLQELIDDTAKVVTHADKRSESVVHDLRHIQERTAGFDDAIARMGESVGRLEATFPVLLERARKSMFILVFGSMALAVLGIAGAIIAMLM